MANEKQIKDLDLQKQAELDPFSINAKSSVEIKNTTRGITWKIKVVTGEETLIIGLMEKAVKVHKALESKLLEGGKTKLQKH